MSTTYIILYFESHSYVDHCLRLAITVHLHVLCKCRSNVHLYTVQIHCTGTLYIPIINATFTQPMNEHYSHGILNWVVSVGSLICILVCVLFDGLSVAIPIQIHF